MDKIHGFKKLLKTIWGVIYPIIIYTLVTVVIEFAFFGAFTIFGLIIKQEIPDTSVLESHVLLITGIAAIVTLPILIYLYNNDTMEMGIDVKRYRKVPIKILIICFFGAAGLSIIGNVIISILFRNYNDADYSSVSQSIYNTNIFITIITAGIIVPITEEMLFRGLVYRRIRTAYGVIPAIILSAVGFGIFHGNITQGVYASMLGLLLAFAYEKTEKMLTCILMHQGANLLSVGLTYAVLYQSVLAIVLMVLLCVSSVVLMIVMICQLLKYNKYNPKENPEYEAYKYISPLL